MICTQVQFIVQLKSPDTINRVSSPQQKHIPFYMINYKIKSSHEIENFTIVYKH